MAATSEKSSQQSFALPAGDREIRTLSINTIRGLAMDAVQKANAGHPGTAMALAPLAYTLYRHVLRVNPNDTAWRDRDRFVLSAGHACVLQYALTHLCGFDLSLEDLQGFRQWGSRTPGHPERGHTPGVEITTGPLGQGIANAVGMAMAERFLAERFNRPGYEVVDHRTYAICSDGDMMEGVSQEAASIAGHFGLGKLTVCYDDNRITIDGTTSISFDTENHLARMHADGWHVQRVEDSEDVDALHEALCVARTETERPSFILVRSHIAYPAPNAVDTAKAHGAPLGEEEVRATKQVMGFDPDLSFQVQDGVYEHMSLRNAGAAAQQEWERREAGWRERYPQQAEEWDRAWSGRLVDGWQEALPSFPAAEQIATRSAGQKVMAALGQFGPTLAGGAADLVESTKTLFEGAGEYSRVHTGRNIPFGIREHAMGAIVNGLAAHGGMVKPYGSTFLVFSDYMRASVRLSALMGLPVVWVWTHDSVGLGEDGPTHQPVEHYAALRAIPHLWVIRPADANETTAAWRVALEREDGPVALLLSRQNLPVLDRTQLGAADGLERGGYVLWDSTGTPGAAVNVAGGAPAGPAPEIVLIATGSEVAPTLQAGQDLAAQGTRVRVVSMPCMELFEAQPSGYRDGVIPSEVRARLAVETGVSMSWWKWVGDHGDVLGIDHFGASAPGPTVLKEFGFTPESIASRARELLKR
ncbi:MAG TPA: transketolase [Solirubrobacteraceae bacterium]|jgi:transketolase|nr:transketolase [Solirubrobacteraceae bacterium]